MEKTTGFSFARAAGIAAALAFAVFAALDAAIAGEAFTLATFNVRCPGDKGDLRWYRRMPRVAEVIRNRGFDVFGVQEAVYEEYRILDDELPGFAHVGCGRNADHGGEAMLVYYSTNRFECLENGTFWLSETPDEPGSKYPGAGCPRTCTWALLKDKSTGDCFRYFNTHLDHVSAQARIDGAKVMFERGIQPALERGETVFLTGDMNDVLDREAVDSPELVASLRGPALADRAKENPIAYMLTQLNDTFATSETPHTGPVNTFHGFNGEPLVRIDYIFTTPDVRVLEHATFDDTPEGLFASDHYPVAIKAVLPDGAGTRRPANCGAGTCSPAGGAEADKSAASEQK
jgi:endonuclease/exonuclease/phosphatase family metal-dependent hydrolase